MVGSNFHAHTVRCGHATGTEREYIEQAIAKGFKVCGFSDHTPQPFANGFVSRIRMGMEEFDGYVKTLRSLKAEYEDRIEVRIGLEAEYYPSCFEKLLEETEKRGIEYLILGQHFVPEEETGFYAGSVTYSEYDLVMYVEHTIEALETGKFLYLAHPDLIHFLGDEDIYLKHMERLCAYAKERDILLEVNGLGLLINRWYPGIPFFKLASSMGCSFVFGCDAHDPTQIRQPEDIPGMSEFLAETGVSFINL